VLAAGSFALPFLTKVHYAVQYGHVLGAARA
jgi:hypothetical protein